MEGMFIPAIVLVCIGGWVVNTWIRARHGYPLENDDGTIVHKIGIDEGRRIELLSSENADLKGKIVRLEERVAVLERIATDKGSRLAAEIDALR